MMGAIILQGTHFLAPRSTMVTIPLAGISLVSAACAADKVSEEKKGACRKLKRKISNPAIKTDPAGVFM
jgi:hypothetical protein